MTLKTNRYLLNVEVPVLDRLLFEKQIAHFLDFSHLVFRVDPSLSQGVSHACTFADAVWYSIKHAELWWKVIVLVGDLHEEKWLLESFDLLIVDGREVLSHRSVLITVLEFVGHRVLVKGDIRHNVGPLVTPVCNDTLLGELDTYHLHPAVFISPTLFPKFIDPFQASCC